MSRPPTKGAAAIAVAVLALLLLPVFVVALVILLAAEEEEQADTGSTCQVTTERSSTGEDKAEDVPNGWGDLVDAAAEEAGLPPSLVAAQIEQESQWNPDATSPVGAEGLAQFMPATWASYGEGGDPRNPRDAIPALGRYMADLKDQVQPLAGDDANELVRLTLAAYNAGPGAVLEHDGVPPYEETQNYVETILGTGQDGFSAECASPAGAISWDGDLGEGEWTTPLPNGTLTSAGSYGPRNIPGYPAWANKHDGVDLATDHSSYGLGGPVVAPADLEVLAIFKPDGCVQARLTAEDSPAFGMAFCHLGEIDVQAGDTLERGDILGTEGNHGESLGNTQGGHGFITHLHFEMYPPDMSEAEMKNPGTSSPLDPEPILKEKGAWP